MSDQSLTPALSAAEWAAMRRYAAEKYAPGDEWLFTAYADNQPDCPSYKPNWDDPAIAAALALASLPADDPRKITWADVELIEVTGMNWDPTSAEGKRYRALAAKLAALLPPR